MEKMVTINVFNSDKFDNSQRWFMPINDAAFTCSYEVPSLAACDPRYADSEWACDVPHPHYIRLAEEKHPGQILVYNDFGKGRDRLLALA